MSSSVTEMKPASNLGSRVSQAIRRNIQTYTLIIAVVVISKWLLSKPQVLIMDDPTRGIDVGAKFEIYKLMNELAERGVAVIMISSDLEEVLGMSDRVMVMCRGHSTLTLPISEASQERVMALATGVAVA